MARSADFKTPLAIVSFSADLFKPREREGGKKGYGCTLLFPKTSDISAITNAILQAAEAEWGEKAKQWLKDGVIKNPVLDGDGPQAVSKKTGERHAGYAGHWFIRCSSGADYPPKVYDRQRNEVFDLEGCRSGSKVYAVINAYTWEHPTNGKGIRFGISMVQLVKNAEGDEVLGGSNPSPDRFFEVIDDEGDAPAAVQGGAGAAGLAAGPTLWLGKPRRRRTPALGRKLPPGAARAVCPGADPRRAAQRPVHTHRSGRGRRRLRRAGRPVRHS